MIKVSGLEEGKAPSIQWLVDAAPRRGISPTIAQMKIWLAIGIISTCLFQYSRLVTIFMPTIATLGFAIIFAGLMTFALCAVNRLNSYYLLCQLATLVLIYFAVWRFNELTAFPYDPRTVGYFAGTFLAFTFLAMFQTIGVERSLRIIFLICAAYCTIYCAASLILIKTGSLGLATRANAILYDPGRGARLFANSTAICYVIIYSVHNLMRLKKVPFYGILLGIGGLALLLANSRMSMLSMFITCCLMLVHPRGRKMRYILIPLIATFLLSSVVILQTLEELEKWFGSTDTTLLTRADSISVTKYVYQYWPFFGLGYASSADLYEMALKKPFYPEDLGGIGLVSNFGILGLLWVCGILSLMSVGIKSAFNNDYSVPAGYIGLYIIVYSFTWPTVIYGDGSIFCSMLTAFALFRPIVPESRRLTYIRTYHP